VLYQVEIGVLRIDGMRTWGATAGEFECRLAGQESGTVIAPRIDRHV
jgi:hypothetical protein